MPRYLVYPASPHGNALASFELQCADDGAAWHMAGAYLRTGSADIWEEGRYVGALALSAAHPSMRVRT